MKPAIRAGVRKRAESRCEYCRLHEDDDVLAFHVEHIISVKHGGRDAIDNLALACQQCNLHKGANLTGIDPESGELTPLYHPRQQDWSDHFLEHADRIVGITAIGRTTVRVLQMNDPDRMRTRWLACGPRPPESR